MPTPEKSVSSTSAGHGSPDVPVLSSFVEQYLDTSATFLYNQDNYSHIYKKKEEV